MSDLRERNPQTLTVREGQMVFAIPSSEEGVDETVYVDDESANASSSSEPVNLGGAWAHLVDDGDALLEAIERTGHESPPTPPITSID